MTDLCKTCIHRKPCMYEEIGVTSCTYYLQKRPKGRWIGMKKIKDLSEYLVLIFLTGVFLVAGIAFGELLCMKILG